ncbi:hypothetical protein DFS34DRAFT_613420 [Phlyctochytrium arcticum]|nr:hypothetical protein DFS34DRAFT_613420 [Phlyctochytrium arcticum]
MSKPTQSLKNQPSYLSFPYDPATLTWTTPEHTHNSQGVYCYCGKDKSEGEALLQCQTCRQCFHSECARCLPKPVLAADSFYTFQCSVCGGGKQSYERLKMSWLSITHLAIYTLLMRTPGKEHVQWKEDICNFIDEYWNYLKPGQPKSPTWHNTVASVLSTAQGKVFKSGTEKFGQTGHWGLQRMEPPVLPPPKNSPARDLKAKATPTRKRKAPESSDSPASTKKTKTSSALPSVRPSRHSAARALEKLEELGKAQRALQQHLLDSDNPKVKVEPHPTTTSGPSKPLAGTSSPVAKTITSVVRNPSTVSQVATSVTTVKSSKLSTAPSVSAAPTAVSVRAPSETRTEATAEDIFGHSDSELSDLSANESPEQETFHTPKKEVEEENDAPLLQVTAGSLMRSPMMTLEKLENVMDDADSDPDFEDQSGSDDADGVEFGEDTKIKKSADNVVDVEYEKVTASHSVPEVKKPTARSVRKPPRAPPPKYRTFMSPEQEFALLQKLNSYSTLPPTAARLRNKIHLRRLKRSVGLPIFDLDGTVSRSLRESRPAPTPIPPSRIPQVHMPDGSVRPLKIAGLDTRRALERFKAVKDITETPYARSFKSRLYGDPFTRFSLTPSTPRVSPYTGIVLKPYIWRNYKCAPPRKQLLETIASRGRQADAAYTPAAAEEKSWPIDYVYLDKMQLGDVNDLLCRTFWPGIDASENLFHPDFTIVALYKRVVVGCAFMTPEGYISYIAVKAGWGGAGIGRFMLFHLMQVAAGKDITLHVSANNRAMILYQRFGFKPEQFIVGFYEKYLPAESKECKNAFFIRLRR